MSSKTREQKRARALQAETGWSYTECLRLVLAKSEDEIDVVMEQRAAAAKEALSREGTDARTED